MSKTITPQMIEEEKGRMAVERELFGRHLLWPENEQFWVAQERAGRRLARRKLAQRLMRALRLHG